MALPFSYNLRSLRVRWKTTLLAIGGIALVVAVFITLRAMDAGFRATLRSTGRADNAIVVQQGSLSELTSGISRADANIIISDERVARDAQGRALASPEVVIVASLPRKTDGADTNVLLRGVSEATFSVRSGVHIEHGRRLAAGLQEIIVGRQVRERYGLEPGSVVRLQRRNWEVVGVFASEGSGFESEIWADVHVLASVSGREGGYQSLTVRLADTAQLEAFKATLEDDPRMQVQVEQERAYYANQTGTVGNALLGLALLVSTVMGIGAVFGAMNTMYAIVASRTREIGTLRALGFSRRAVLLSFVLEAVILATVGGLLGCALALPANGLTAAVAGSNFSDLAFAFRITPQTLGAGLAFAITMGLVGGLLPALRAARLPISAALREA